MFLLLHLFSSCLWPLPLFIPFSLFFCLSLSCSPFCLSLSLPSYFWCRFCLHTFRHGQLIYYKEDFSSWTSCLLHGAESVFCSFPLWFQFCPPGPDRTQPTPPPWALQVWLLWSYFPCIWSYFPCILLSNSFSPSAILHTNVSRSLFILATTAGHTPIHLDLFQTVSSHMDQYSSSRLGNRTKRTHHYLSYATFHASPNEINKCFYSKHFYCSVNLFRVNK